MAEQFESLPFIFAGWRESKGRLAMAIVPLRNDEMEKPMYFSATAKRRWAVGGVYSGAEFGETQAKGLDSALYERKWADTGLVIEWTALSEQAEAVVRSIKAETDARKHNEIETCMLPLRQQYARLQKQRNKAGIAALEEAVLRALRAPVRAAEITD